MLKTSFRLLICLFLPLFTLEAKVSDVKVTRFNVTDGLADNSIYCLLQDHQGLIWFGTRDGLHRYDGYTYKIFQQVESDSSTIQNRDIYSLFEDSEKNIWIGSNSVLSRYDRETDSFRNYTINPDRKVAKNITQITEDNQGRLWVLIPNQGLFQFDTENEIFIPMNEVIPNFMAPWEAIETPDNPEGLWEMQIKFNPHRFGDTLQYKFFVKYERGPRLWEQDVPGGKGHYKNRTLILNKQKIIHGPLQFEGPEPGLHTQEPDSSINYSEPILVQFLMDTTSTKPPLKPGQFIGTGGDIWPLSWGSRGTPKSVVFQDNTMLISTGGAGLYTIDLQTGLTKAFSESARESHGPSTNDLGSSLIDQKGIVWSASNFGLNRFDPKSQTFSYFTIDGPKEIDVAGSQRIKQLTLGPDGLIWMTTQPGHAYSFDPASLTFVDRIPLNSSRLSDIMVDHSGIIWVGSIDEGLSQIDPGINKFKLYAQDIRDENSSYGKYIQAIEEDEDGNFWIAGELGALYYVNRNTHEFQRIPYPEKRFAWQHFNYVPDLLFDDNGSLWITTLSGLLNYDPSSGNYSMFLHSGNDHNTISNNDNNGLFKDSKGNIWVLGYRLNRFDPETGGFVRHFEVENPEIMKNNLTASNMVEDEDGNFWISTFIYGIVRFDAVTHKLRTYVRDEFDVQRTHHSLLDSQGRLWYTRDNKGLFQFDITQEKEIKQITEADGLLHDAIQGIQEDANGNLWISSHRGLTRYDPEKETFDHYFKEDGLQDNEFRYGASGKTYRNELFFGGQYGFNLFHPDSIFVSTYRPPVVITDLEVSSESRYFSQTEQIELSHFENDLTFHFSALDYSLPERNLYTYYLDNYDDEWHEPSNRNYAEYTNLDPGTYIFNVKGSNRDGIWNERPESLTFIIAPPWWEAWWAYLIYLGIIGGIILALRINEMNRINLKNQVKLEEAKLKEREEVDRLKSNFFTNISHEFRTPLTLIIGPLGRLIKEAKDNDTAKRLNIMYRNATRLLKLINQLLDISKLEAHELKLQASQSNIVKFIRGILMSFHSLAEQKDVSIEFESEQEDIQLYFDWDKAEKIFSNLLSNAFKFTPAKGRVSVSIKTGDQGSLSGVFIHVKDTGIGIPPDDLQKIFQRFHQVDNRLAREHEGSGIGLALTSELVELHHGAITANSIVEAGTEFIVFLPLGSEHLSEDEIVIETTASEDEVLDIDSSQSEEPVRSGEGQEELPLVLIVEDNDDMRLYINDVLSGTYRIAEAHDGEMGVHKALELLPDLIVTDLMMPKKDGFELCQELKLKESTSHIPIILLTAKADKEDKLEGLETGADDYLTKPFDSTELSVRIRNLVNQRQQLRDKFSDSIRIEASEITVTSMDAQFLQKAIDLVEENLEDDEFSIETFSEKIGLSRRQFYQKIKSITGLTPTEFVLNIRLKRAAVLIGENAGNISEIAYSVGFNNLSYFARAFKKQFGTTPSKYTPQ